MRIAAALSVFAVMVTGASFARLLGYDFIAVLLSYGAMLPLLWPFRVKSATFARELSAKGQAYYARTYAAPIGAAIFVWGIATDLLRSRLTRESVVGSVAISLLFVVAVATLGWKQLCKDATAD